MACDTQWTIQLASNETKPSTVLIEQWLDNRTSNWQSHDVTLVSRDVRHQRRNQETCHSVSQQQQELAHTRATAEAQMSLFPCGGLIDLMHQVKRVSDRVWVLLSKNCMSHSWAGIQENKRGAWRSSVTCMYFTNLWHTHKTFWACVDAGQHDQRIRSCTHVPTSVVHASSIRARYLVHTSCFFFIFLSEIRIRLCKCALPMIYRVKLGRCISLAF